MKAEVILRWSAAALAVLLIAFLVKNASGSNAIDLLEAKADSKSGAFDNDIMALAWHPGSKVLTHKGKAAIPGLAPWAKALLDTAAKEQIQEVNRHAKSVKEQEELLAKQKRAAALARQRKQNEQKVQMENEMRMLQKRAKTSLKMKPAEASKIKANAHLQAKKASEAKLPPKLQTINKKKESRFAAYAEVKTFFRHEESSLEDKKKAAIARVKEEASAGVAKIEKDERSDLAKVTRLGPSPAVPCDEQTAPRRSPRRRS